MVRAQRAAGSVLLRSEPGIESVGLRKPSGQPKLSPSLSTRAPTPAHDFKFDLTFEE